MNKFRAFYGSTIKGIRFTLEENDLQFIPTDMSFVTERISDKFWVGFDFKENSFETGMIFPGFNQFKSNLYVSTLDGILEIK